MDFFCFLYPSFYRVFSSFWNLIPFSLRQADFRSGQPTLDQTLFLLSPFRMGFANPDRALGRSSLLSISRKLSTPFGTPPFSTKLFPLASLLAYCSTETTLSFSAGPVCSSFSTKAYAILQALGWSRQRQQVCHFSSFLLSSLCSRHPVFFSVFLFTSISLEDLAETVFSLLQFYQATIGRPVLVFPGERRG